MEFHVEITDKALSDAENAYLWIYEHSPEQAVKWYNALLDAVFSLETFPARCTLAAESTGEREVRQLLAGKRPHLYRVLFEIQQQTVYVLRIRHGAMEHLEPDELGSDELGSDELAEE